MTAVGRRHRGARHRGGPPRRLVQTWHPTCDAETASDPATRLTFEIEPDRAGGTRLAVTHDVTDTPHLAAIFIGAIPNAGGGWSEQLIDLKILLETGAPLVG